MRASNDRQQRESYLRLWVRSLLVIGIPASTVANVAVVLRDRARYLAPGARLVTVAIWIGAAIVIATGLSLFVKLRSRAAPDGAA